LSSFALPYSFPDCDRASAPKAQGELIVVRLTAEGLSEQSRAQIVCVRLISP
jgi:hypothetical protein